MPKPMASPPLPNPPPQAGEGANVMPNPINEILIDGHGLEPPEPMVRVLAALDAARPGQTLRLLLPREPFPLYPLLAARGWRHDTVAQADGNYVIHICRPPTGAAS